MTLILLITKNQKINELSINLDANNSFEYYISDITENFNQVNEEILPLYYTSRNADIAVI